jgi:hypothetical protein
MRTADNAIDRRHGENLMLPDKRQDLNSGFVIVSQIFFVGMPSLQGLGVGAFVRNDADRNFTGALIVRAIEGNRGDRITSEASLRFLCDRICNTPFDFHDASWFGYRYRTATPSISTLASSSSKLFTSTRTIAGK